MSQHTRNLITAAALSLIFIGLWDYFYAWPLMDRQRIEFEQQKRQAKLPKLGAPERAGAEAAKPAVAKTRAEARAQSPRIAIDTRSLAGSIALKGGRIDDLSLKNYRETVDPGSPNITLFSPEGGPTPYFAEAGYLSVETENAPALPTTETLWTADSDKLTATHPVTLTYDNGQGLLFKRKISVDDEYLFKIEDTVDNSGDKPVVVYPFSRIVRIGKITAASYGSVHEGFIGVIGNEAVQEIRYEKIDKEPNATRTLKGAGGWVGLTDKYWGAVAAPDPSAVLEAQFSSSGSTDLDKTYESQAVSEPKTIEPHASLTTTLHIFAGAKEVDTINAYEKNEGFKLFDRLIDWGYFYIISQKMFVLIDFLYKILGNFGLAVLGVTVIVKAAFLPIANSSYKAMAKMKEIQPKLKELKEKYGDDKHKFNTEQMELYKREKVSPLGGCVPMLLQIPVFISLYKVLSVTIEMRHAPFYGWIRDLSAPDPTNIFTLFGLLHYDPTKIAIFGSYMALGIWPLLMGVTMWLQMKMNPEPTDEMQKTLFSWMPVMFTFTMGSFASGLVIYWTWNNLLSIIQQWVIYKRAGAKFELWNNLRKTFGLA